MPDDTRTCPKCNKPLQSNGVIHAIPAFGGHGEPVAKRDLTPVVIFVCPECRHIDLYLASV
jgi:endogenous inhibitor of DNA gyrase (YacG/DUF329 family)